MSCRSTLWFAHERLTRQPPVGNGVLDLALLETLHSSSASTPNFKVFQRKNGSRLGINKEVARVPVLHVPSIAAEWAKNTELR